MDVYLVGKFDYRMGPQCLVPSNLFIMIVHDLSIAQFFSRNSSPASQQVCRPGAEQADKFMF
jgi:hypothetical protein